MEVEKDVTVSPAFAAPNTQPTLVQGQERQGHPHSWQRGVRQGEGGMIW